MIVRQAGILGPGLEIHGRPGAVVRRIGAVVRRQVGEILHVDLHAAAQDSRVVLVEPRTGRLVVGADNDVRLTPGGAACLAHVPQPTSLGAIRPCLD